MRTQNFFLTVLACLPALAFSGTNCEPVVDATLAEIKAGSTDWDERTESLVRAAAGAACVKAYSGVYADRSAVDDANQSDAGQPESTPPAVALETATVAPMEETTASVVEDDAGWWPKLKRNKNSASPRKKPYARKRD